MKVNMNADELIKKLNDDEKLSCVFKKMFNEFVDRLNYEEGCENYCKEFNESWKPYYDRWDRVVSNLKYINATIFLTDCDDDRDKFPKYFYKDRIEIKSSSLMIDIMMNRTYWSVEAEKIMNIFFGNPYDNNESEDAYWRDIFVYQEDVDEILHKLVMADTLIGTYFEMNDLDIKFNN